MVVKNAIISGSRRVVSNSEEGEVPLPGCQHRQRDEQPAEDGGRQVVAGQDRHGPAEQVAEEQDHAAERQAAPGPG